MSDLLQVIVAKANYWVYIVLMMIGLFGMIAKTNLIKKIIGMGILQTAIILFFISIGAKQGAQIPIIAHSSNMHGQTLNAADYINPLPHVLMLTAIVVAVATLGVALALAIKVYRQYDSLEEDEILAQVRTRENEK
jgi:multicomponent Na+:H+ antiporter subunit C